MAQQKTHTNNEGFGGRTKKYDAYTPRPGSLHRAQRFTQPRPHPEQQVRYQLQPKKTVEHQELAPRQNTKLALHNQHSYQTHHKKTSVFKNHSTATAHYTDNRSGTSARRSNSSDAIALKAVHASKLAENAQYPDQFSTVYASGRRKLTRLQKVMYSFGVIVFLFSMFVSVQSFMTNKQAKEQIATLGESTTKDDQGVSEGTSEDPSEEPIPESAILAFKPASPEDPRVLRIPEIGVLARIKSLGVTPGGAVDTPKNIYDAGWYNGGARPGNPVGSSLILGHVSGWTGPGVFKNINKLKAGSRFEIEKGTGEKVYYEVTRTEQIPANQVDMSKILATEVAGQHDIKLMTCSGRYNAQTKSFDDRFVVYGKQIK